MLGGGGGGTVPGLVGGGGGGAPVGFDGGGGGAAWGLRGGAPVCERGSWNAEGGCEVRLRPTVRELWTAMDNVPAWTASGRWASARPQSAL